jgi:hypothetical protein
VKLHHHGIGIVGSTEGIANVKFKQAIKMHAVAVVDSEQIWLSLEDRDAFLAMLGEAAGVPIGPFAKFWGT